MLSLFLRGLFFEFGQKKFSLWSFWGHKLVSITIFLILVFLGTLKIIKIFTSLRVCFDFYAHA
jgi:hypothetical protein